MVNGDPTAWALLAGKRDVAGAFGFCGRLLRSGYTNSCSGRGRAGGAAAWRCMMAALLSAVSPVVATLSPGVPLSAIGADGSLIACADNLVVGVALRKLAHTINSALSSIFLRIILHPACLTHPNT